MWATKQPRQTRDEVLRGLDVTTKRVNLWSGCRWIPELRLPLGHDAYNFARIARDLPARSSSCERGPAAHLSNGQYRVCAAAARRRPLRPARATLGWREARKRARRSAPAGKGARWIHGVLHGELHGELHGGHTARLVAAHQPHPFPPFFC